MTLIQAAAALGRVLEAENAALEALDLAAVMALLGEKQAASDSFVGAQAAVVAAGGLDEALRPEAEAWTRRLEALVGRNRGLLVRAMDVQRRVIEVLVRSVAPAVARAPRYTSAGAAETSRPAAVTLATSA